MSYLAFGEKLKRFIEVLGSNREEESLIIGKETIALVRLRIQNKGEDSEGQSLGSYSQAVVPQPFYYGRSLSDGAEDEIKEGSWFLSYETFREFNNLRTDIKDLTFTGDMWRNTGVTRIENQTNKTIVTLGGQTTRAEELISYHSDKYGNILAPSESEIQFIVESHIERINNAINEIFS